MGASVRVASILHPRGTDGWVIQWLEELVDSRKALYLPLLTSHPLARSTLPCRRSRVRVPSSASQKAPQNGAFLLPELGRNRRGGSRGCFGLCPACWQREFRAGKEEGPPGWRTVPLSLFRRGRPEPLAAAVYARALAGCMNAPKIQSSGKKIPRKNIHPCPFRSVLRPSQTKRTIQRRAPKPIPHHTVASHESLTGLA